jgi:hypothetical protein
MEALSVIIYLAQAKTSGTTCLYIEIVDMGCIDFVSFKNYKNIVARKYRI